MPTDESHRADAGSRAPVRLLEATKRARAAAGLLRAAGPLDRAWPRAYTALAKAVGRALGGDPTLVERSLPDGATFAFPLADFYYVRLLRPEQRYEPDLALLVDRLRGRSLDVLDCGANMGYWTVQFVSLGGRVVAVEASGTTFTHLERNVATQPHRDRITLVHGAVSDHAGDVLSLYTYVGHAGATLDQDNVNASRRLVRVEEVTTVTVDDLVARHALRTGAHLLVKLDVEGVELAALAGGRRALESGALFVYEEYARNPRCEPTEWLLTQDDIVVHLLDPTGGAPHRIRAAADVEPFKRAHPRAGLNLVAMRTASAEALADVLR
jgi:FkbM family methyltransferase